MTDKDLEVNQTIYQQNGYRDRRHYLECMSEDYGVPLETVLVMAECLGADEDFDGLISSLEDASDCMD